MICNQEVKNYVSLGLHLRRTHNIDSKLYYDTYLRKPNEGYCICGKETSFQGIRLGYLKYCSSKCSNNDLEVIHKREQTCFNHYGVTNPYQSEEIKEKIKQTMLSNTGKVNFSEEMIIFQDKYGCTIYGAGTFTLIW